MTNPQLAAFRSLSPAVQQGLLRNPKYAAYIAALEMNYSNQPGTIVTPSQLVCDGGPLGTQNLINFNLSTAGVTQAWETRLDQNDNFHAIGFSLALCQYNGTTITGANANRHYFPNRIVFGATVAAQLEAIYNGFLNAVINGRAIMKNIALQDAKYVGTAQESISLYSGTEVANTSQTYMESQVSQERIVEIMPGLLLNGQSNPSMTINLGGSAAMGGTAPAANHCILTLYGFLAQAAR